MLVCAFRCTGFSLQTQLMQCLDDCIREHRNELIICLGIHDDARNAEQQLTQCTLNALNTMRHCVAEAKQQYRNCLTQGTRPTP